ncbi:MAG: pyruvate carboxylase subunit B [Kosmotogaceae bacterium]
MSDVGFVDTTFRDAHQSLLATRVATDELVRIVDIVDQIGYDAVEMWGGATFDACVRYLKENPWERIDKLRKHFKNTEMQMLLRGQNLVGYRHYADDVVELFIKTMAKHGMDRVRVFDALNDFRNIKKSRKEIKKNNMHLQIAIAYTVSPVHNVDLFVDYARSAEKLDADSLCIKDMAGLLTPDIAYELISKIKEETSLPVDVHAHFTSGLADLTYLKSVEAGADLIDTAISSLASGTSQPPAESLWIALNKLGYAEKPDLKNLKSVRDYFYKIREQHRNTDIGMKTVNPEILINQIPGGMMSNLINQLREQKALHKLEDVLQEIPEVRKDLGYPPLVTPSSQIVGVQSVVNVLSGERYKIITNETKNYIKGLYGNPPGDISEDLKKVVMKNEEPLEYRPADYLEPEVESAKEKIGLLANNNEELLIYILLEDTGRAYLLNEYEKNLKIDMKIADTYSDKVAIYPI